MKRICIFSLLLYIISPTCSQVAGKGVFAFLNMPSSSRQLAMGSGLSGVVDNDISLGYNNPASLNPKMNNHAFVSYNNFVSDIKFGYFSYARSFKNTGTLSAGLMYLDYGNFDGYTPAGIATGTFTAKDQCFHLSYGKQYKEKFRVGATFKYIYSIYESYVSNGLSTDLSGMYEDTANRFSATVYARNIGFQAIPYSGTARQKLPFELDLVLTKKLAHLPFRYNLVFHNLQKPDMRYTIRQTGEKDENGNDKEKTMNMGDNILRHIILGGELNISKNLYLRFGYNHMKRKELTQEQKRGSTGFSWGLGFRISKFHISYGSAAYFPGINSNQFSVLLNLGDLYKKK